MSTRITNLRSHCSASALSTINLPLELIYDISDFLPPDAVLALKLTHRNFNSILPLDSKLNKTPLSDCARLATRTYLSKPSPEPSHLRCILCKTVYPVNLFKSSSSPACIPTSFTEDVQQTDVVELPQRLCSWHAAGISGLAIWKICACTVVRSRPGQNAIVAATAVLFDQYGPIHDT
ncbi:hypothetical protein SNOG_12820 [Parastagonospora nodorum SN15]|uniref:F-box domain-containing protein n=1 Tax=Phaeosphaeria nodorum (strain SN15 / ATCC MYA-4574 / FGSC 10173) TaxID=321614 RepID=Q0U5Z4_PHANO|nr:hypothetical protein SNOG_12820 [Parastagonospora nodorum SN15]EAT79620.1 hypothetical protein SNOG_12820 [Parastagonospora nodorum SN15]